MKDQYIGDYNDFVKYALLRAILAQKLPLLVCWMLTPDDRSSEGGKLGYLEKPETFRHLDPDAFDGMAELVAAGSRSVAEVEASRLLAGAAYFSRPLEDPSSSRSAFFRELWRQPPSVTFFDPDNGFEVPSKPSGLGDSSKYIYWSEVEETFRLGHSVIVFQHFSREKRAEHLRRLLDQLGESHRLGRLRASKRKRCVPVRPSNRARASSAECDPRSHGALGTATHTGSRSGVL